MRQRPVIWKPRYATRRMREQAWASADRRREQASEPGRRRSVWAKLADLVRAVERRPRV